MAARLMAGLVGTGVMARFEVANIAGSAAGFVGAPNFEVATLITLTCWWRKRRLAARSCLTLLVAIGAMTSSPVRPAAAQTHQPWKVTAPSRLRSTPSAHGKVVAYVPRDAVVIVAGNCSRPWCAVAYGGRSGWLFHAYLSKPGVGSNVASVPATVGSAPTISGNAEVRQAALKLAIPTAAIASPPDRIDGLEPVSRYTVVGLNVSASLPMREAPSADAQVLGTLGPGQGGIEDLNECVRQWCRVEVGGVKGYVLGRFLGRAALSDGRRFRIGGVEGEALKVYEFPGADANTVGEIPFYADGIVPIGDCSADWCHIRYLGLVGWVNSPRLVSETSPGS